MKQQTRDWVNKAEGDFRIATREMQAPDPVYDAVCFHAQQCVEKYLKAVLEEAGIPFPRTHDLAFLVTLGLPLWPDLRPHEASLKALTTYAVAFRYPGESAGREEAEDSVATMTAVHMLLRKRLGLESA